MSLKPWREIIMPHSDVLKGTFQQSEFAADLTAVWTGRATPEYGDAKAFYERTFITEGMGKLLTQVAQRLNGKGGEPVIQLQTSFGGGCLNLFGISMDVMKFAVPLLMPMLQRG